MAEQTVQIDHITLSQAAKLAPGRPSTNCLWRWCRRGVLARGGQRLRLRHIRAGGKIFTSAPWIEEFCRRLAQTDTEYFAERDEAAAASPPRDPRYDAPVRGSRQPRSPSPQASVNQVEIEGELEEEGL